MMFASLDLLDSLEILLFSLLPFHAASTRLPRTARMKQKPCLIGARHEFFAAKQGKDQKQDCQRQQDGANRARVEDRETAA